MTGVVNRIQGTRSRLYKPTSLNDTTSSNNGGRDVLELPAGGLNGGNGGASMPSRGPLSVPPALAALNPPFDPRMRRIGSPLNQGGEMKRGWISSQSVIGALDGREGNLKTDPGATSRVNFLFNPSQLDVQHAVDAENTKSPLQGPESGDVMDPFYSTTGSSLGLSLLYDRTYELFSGKNAKNGTYAHEYGVYADVAAWYTYLKMLPEYPTTGLNGVQTQPMNLVPSYLFINAGFRYYGFVSSLSVTYSHWTQYMVPQRCKIDISYNILPDVEADPNTTTEFDSALPGSAGVASSGGSSTPLTGGWFSDLGAEYGSLPGLLGVFQ